MSVRVAVSQTTYDAMIFLAEERKHQPRGERRSRHDGLPPRQVVSTLVCRDGTLVNENGYEHRASKKCERIEQLVNLGKEIQFVNKSRQMNGLREPRTMVKAT